MERKQHWERVYGTKATTEVSWFQERAALSLGLIRDASVLHTAAVIDVGGGASTLVDGLITEGFEDVTVLDLSGAALAAARDRLGAAGSRVRWIEASILDVELPEHGYDVWHDRAVFHFLTDPDDRRAYVEQVLHAVKPGGLVIVATFAEDGPTQCSGLPVMRYSSSELHAEFGTPFELVAKARETHSTPGGSEQRFVYCMCRKDPSTEAA